MKDKSNFVEYHLPCDSCGSSDARSINDDGSSYCFACENYFPPDSEDIIIKKREGEPMQVAQQPQPQNVSDFGYHTGVSSAISDRGINEDACKTFGVKIIRDSNGVIQKHIYPYYDERGTMIGTKTRFVSTKQFSIVGSTPFDCRYSATACAVPAAPLSGLT